MMGPAGLPHRARRRLLAPAHWARGAALTVVVALVVGALGGTAPASAQERSRPRPAPAQEARRLVGAGTTTTTAPKAPAVPDVAHGHDSLHLVSQDFWVGPSPSTFAIHLDITASNEADEKLAVAVSGSLSARSQFQAALGGEFPNLIYPASVPLTALSAAPGGGVDVDIPVDQEAGSPQLPCLCGLTTTGVYPVQLFLEEGGVRMGQPLTTFLVFVGSDAVHFQKLGVAVVVPMDVAGPSFISADGTPGPVPASAAPDLLGDAATVAQYAAAVAESRVPVTLKPSPSTMEALTTGTTTDRLALSQVQTAVADGDEVLPGTTLPVDLGALAQSGLTLDLANEVNSGRSELATLLSQVPAIKTWASGGPMGPSGVGALIRAGVTQLVLPEGDLSGVPASYTNLTFAQPARLVVGGRSAMVVGADSELSSRVAQGAGPNSALVADQVVAELCMIDLEQPGIARGVVVMPPFRSAVSPAFLTVLLQGLRQNPLLQAVTASQLFAQVKPASTKTGVLVRRLADQQSSAPLGGIGLLTRARAAVMADLEVYGQSFQPAYDLSQRLYVSLSSAFTASERASMIESLWQSARAELQKVRLPPAGSITLTSHQGQLPLTVVSTAPAPMSVLLVLTSEQLNFLPSHFASGSCRPVNAGSAHCHLTLSHTTLLQVRVEVRTSGAFPLVIKVETPDGHRVLSAGTETVRSTAFSDFGLVLMAGAALFLAVWWWRNARHGRRARKLVPRLPDDDDVVGDQAAPSGAFQPTGR